MRDRSTKTQVFQETGVAAFQFLNLHNQIVNLPFKLVHFIIHLWSNYE